MDWIRLTEVPRKYPALEYQSVYRLCLAGKVRSERPGASWWAWEPDVELLAAKTAALRDGVRTPEDLAFLDRAADGVREICDRSASTW
jgi:hypothetical protein